MTTNPQSPLCAHRWAVHSEPKRWQCTECGLRCVTSEVNLAAGESFQAPYAPALPPNTPHAALAAELADARAQLAKVTQERDALHEELERIRVALGYIRLSSQNSNTAAKIISDALDAAKA